MPTTNDTKWETVDCYDGDGNLIETERLPVPGGWLYRTVCFAYTRSTADGMNPVATAMVFVPQSATTTVRDDEQPF